MDISRKEQYMLSSEQHGFITTKSCLMNLVETFELWIKAWMLAIIFIFILSKLTAKTKRRKEDPHANMD